MRRKQREREREREILYSTTIKTIMQLCVFCKESRESDQYFIFLRYADG